MSTLKTIAILLAIHNRKVKTLQCLESLFAQKKVEGYKFEVYLTDDKSSDGSYEAISQKYPNVKIIKGTGDLFWNRGMHLAWNEAIRENFDFYLWLNNDTFLFNNGLEQLIESSNLKTHKSIIVGTTISKVTKSVTYGGRDKNSKLIEPNGKLQYCNHFNGNVVFIPRYVFNKVGNLDSIFHHSIGDFDYGLRAIKKNIQSFIVPDIVGICEGHNRFSKWCEPETPILERIKVLYSSPCECHPYQYFIFEKRHYGIFIAIFHLFTIHIRLLFPKVFNLRKKH